MSVPLLVSSDFLMKVSVFEHSRDGKILYMYN